MFIHYSEHVIDLLDVHVHVGHVKNLLCSKKHETSYKRTLPSNKAFLTPTTVMELLTLFFFLFLPRRHKDEKTSDIAWHWCTGFTFLMQNVRASNLHGNRGLTAVAINCWKFSTEKRCQGEYLLLLVLVAKFKFCFYAKNPVIFS